MKKSFFLFAALFSICIVRSQNIPRVEPNTTSRPVTNNSLIAFISPPVLSVTITNEPCPPAYNKVWMQKNLDVTTYRNGDPIPEVKDPEAWSKLTTGAWCYYDNDPANNKKYGKLYNWYAVNDPRGLAPEGWHIPSNEEWTAMSNGLGGDKVAGGKMKETGFSHWLSPNEDATNTSSFNGLPGGWRHYSFSGGSEGFFYIGIYGFWWSSTQSPSTASACYRTLYNTTGTTDEKYDNKRYGFSVRCIKD